MGMLIQTSYSLSDALTERTALIEEYRNGGAPSSPRLLQFYFGQPNENGVTDQRYSAAIKAISFYVDDCIVFSKLLIEDLTAHGQRRQKEFRANFRGEVPSIDQASFKSAEQKGLFPSLDSYKDWTEMTSG